MKVHSYNEPFPYLIIENVFDDLDGIWLELEYYCKNYEHFFLDPAATGGATVKGQIVKQNSGAWLTSIWGAPELSTICRSSNSMLENFPSQCPDNKFFDGFHCNRMTVLLSHYKDGDHYKAHRDVGIVTGCLWLYKEPKKFTGGDFSFSDYDVTIPCVNNSMVIFPSSFRHEVSPVEMTSDDHLDGRFTVSYFMNHAS